MPSGHILKRTVKFLPAALFILVALLSCYTAYHFAYTLTDADTAGELAMGHLLAEENRLLSTDWVYSSGIRFFSGNLVYMPLLKVLGDWQFARFAAILIFQALLVVSYFYMSRRMKMSGHAFFLSASLMLLPLSDRYGRLVLFQNDFTPCFICGFLIAGLFLSLLQHAGQSRLRQALRLFAVLMLALLSSLNGGGQFLSAVLPLFLTALYLKLRTAGTLGEIARGSWKSAGLAGLICAAGFCGLIIHRKILPLYAGTDALAVSGGAFPTVENLRSLVIGYLGLFGFQEGGTLFSLTGLLSLGGIFVAVVLLCLALGTLLRGKQANGTGHATLLYPVAMLLITTVFLLIPGYEDYPTYYLYAFIWIFPFLGLELDFSGSTLRTFTLKQALVVLVCFCLLFSGLNMHLYYLGAANGPPDSDLYESAHAAEQLEGAIGFIEENGYDVGYATDRHANIVTALTDGKIPMIPIAHIDPYPAYLYSDTLADKRMRERSFTEGRKSFMLLDRQEAGDFGSSKLAIFGYPVYKDEHYHIYAFEYSTDLWEYFLDQAGKHHQTSVLSQLAQREE